jgi:biopolymer transport protein TolR
MTGFAGVMFALVAMFLLPASMVIDSPRNASAVPVDLAKASHAAEMRGALREDALVVAIQRDGRIWFGEQTVTADHLTAAIRERVGRGAERRVYIRADMRARYASVREVLDRVRSAGIEDIGFIVDGQRVP